MHSEHWQRAKDVFAEASALEPQAIEPFLDEACRDDPALRGEIESLLAAHGTPRAIIDRAAVDYMPEAALGSVEDHWIGRRIGAYELVARIGRGGMGDVYRARRADAQFDKEVAIKLVRAGYDTDSIIRHFRYERQILASLESPNIARLYDGGTTEEGVPYLIEELIEGVPVDRYCDERGLGLTARIDLFRQVCAAVQYAHQRSVIHRDIKPNNILVTNDGVPKLIDFGIAKILDQTAQPAATQLRAMTLDYASPEQVRGEVITTSTDVYSLGVVLYQLLTGRMPYAGAMTAAHDLARAICETDPGKPSAAVLKPREPRRNRAAPGEPAEEAHLPYATPVKLHEQLRGDLDNIVLTALRKEPERRYPSVERLADDLRRLQAGLPVAATAGSWRYRGAKFVRRHKVGAMLTAMVTLAVLGGIGAIVRESQIARRQYAIAQEQRQRAEKRFAEVRKLANALLFDIHDSIKDLPGSTSARKLIVTRALEYLHSLSLDAQGDVALQREIASAYQKIGEVQGQSRQASLGDRAAAEASYRKALELREALVARDPNDPDLRRELVWSYVRLSDLLRDQGDHLGAMEYAHKQMATAEAVLETAPANLQNRILFATMCMDYGYKQATVEGDRTRGLENLHRGSAILEQVAEERPQDKNLQRVRGLSYSRDAELQDDGVEGRQRALVLYKKALAVKQTLLDADPNNADYRRLVAYDEFAIGSVLMRIGDLRDAMAWDRKALTSFEQLAAVDPVSAIFRQDAAEVRRDLGQMLVNIGENRAAIAEFQASLAAASKIEGATDPATTAGAVVMADRFWLGQAHAHAAAAVQSSSPARLEHCRAAVDWFEKALPSLQIQRSRSGTDPTAAEQIQEIRAALKRCQPVLRSESADRRVTAPILTTIN